MAKGATRRKPNPGRGRKILRFGRFFVAGGIFLGLCGLVSLGLWRLAKMPVARVVVSGELGEISPEELSELIGASLQGGFFWVDLGPIKESLQSLPWVYRAVVKRRWPDSLEVAITEQTAIARWSRQGYLNHAGDLFEPSLPGGVEDLPRLAGPAGSEQWVMACYKRVQDGVQSLGLRVEELTVDERGSIRALLNGGRELVLGRGDLAAKIRRFRTIYGEKLAARSGEVRSVDLRYGHGAAVAWNNASGAANQKS